MRLTKLMVLILALAMSLAIACGGSPTENTASPTNGKTNDGRATGAMPDTAFKAGVTVANPPTKMRLGEKTTLMVKVKNMGSTTWPSMGRASDGYYQVNVGDRWYDNKNILLDKHPYERVGLGRDVNPGEEVEVALIVIAPSVAGEYTLQIDLVQEMVAWFAEKNNASPKFKVNVQG